MLADIRTLSRETGRHVGILQDLCGPKMRLGPIPDDLVECPLVTEFTWRLIVRPESARELTCSYRELPNDLKTGRDRTVRRRHRGDDRDRGRPERRAAEGDAPRDHCGLAAGAEPARLGPDGPVADREGFARSRLDRTARRRNSIRRLVVCARPPRTLLACAGNWQTRKCPAKVVVKIEKPQAVRHLEEIVAVTDGVMVARGDLGVEMDVSESRPSRNVSLRCATSPPPGHYRDADAQQHGVFQPADAGRSERCLQRGSGRHRRGRCSPGKVPSASIPRSSAHDAANLRGGRRALEGGWLPLVAGRPCVPGRLGKSADRGHGRRGLSGSHAARRSDDFGRH